MNNGCRHCGLPLKHSFCDLGMSPLANSYLTEDQVGPARGLLSRCTHCVCSDCLLVQVGEFESPDAIFSDYAYFSSYSESWVEHARRVRRSEVIARLRPRRLDSQVIEIASNDGYLLQNFVARGDSRVAASSRPRTSRRSPSPARHPDRRWRSSAPNSRASWSRRRAPRRPADRQQRARPRARPERFRRGHGDRCSPPGGVITMEFPHLLQLIEQNQFDTIYHEHFSYFSLSTVERVFARHGLRMFDVEELPTHGGSLRIFACHADDRRHTETTSGCDDAGEGASARRARQPRWVPRLSRDGVQRVEARAAALPDRRDATPARRSCATARPPRATRCSTTAASATTSSTTPSIAARTSRAASCPGTHIPIHRTRAHP